MALMHDRRLPGADGYRRQGVHGVLAVPVDFGYGEQAVTLLVETEVGVAHARA